MEREGMGGESVQAVGEREGKRESAIVGSERTARFTDREVPP